MCYCYGFVAHDGSEGLSPDGWLPDRISVGVLTRAFPPELVDEVGTATPGDIFQAMVYRELRLAVGEAQASLGYEQIHLPAARVDPGSVTRHGDHDDIRIVPVGETPAVIRYRAA